MAQGAKSNPIIDCIPIVRDRGTGLDFMDGIGWLIAENACPIEHVPYKVIVGVGIFNWHKLLPHFLEFVKDNLNTLHLFLSGDKLHCVTLFQEVSGE